MPEAPQQGGMGEEHTLQNTRDERREQDTLEQGARCHIFASIGGPMTSSRSILFRK